MISQDLADRFRGIRAKIAGLPRVSLACRPTPLEEAMQLARHLGGPRIFIKRDDLTGVALGGNKTRNLEFRLGHALKEKPDVVIVGLDMQSNSARQTVGCCNKLGLRTILILTGTRPNEVQGNLLVNYLLGAEIRFAADAAEQRRMIDAAAADVCARGEVPHILNDNPVFEIASAVAYIECVMEILEDLGSRNIPLDSIYMASNGKGQAGLVLAKRLFAQSFKVRCATATREHQVADRTADIANRASRFLNLDIQIDPSEVDNNDGFVGERYGVPSLAGNEAVRLFANSEGLIIDPIYTGKCAAAMIAHIRRGDFNSGQTIVFVHTGGVPAIFSYPTLWL